MEKSKSFLDWEKQFKDYKNRENKRLKREKKGKDFNSLGIPSREFGDFIKKWKKNNL